MFSSHPCSQAPAPQQQNKSGVSFATAAFAGTEVSKSHSRAGIGVPALEGWPPLQLSISTTLELGVTFSASKTKNSKQEIGGKDSAGKMTSEMGLPRANDKVETEI